MGYRSLHCSERCNFVDFNLSDSTMCKCCQVLLDGMAIEVAICIPLLGSPNPEIQGLEKYG